MPNRGKCGLPKYSLSTIKKFHQIFRLTPKYFAYSGFQIQQLIERTRAWEGQIWRGRTIGRTWYSLRGTHLSTIAPKDTKEQNKQDLDKSSDGPEDVGNNWLQYPPTPGLLPPFVLLFKVFLFYPPCVLDKSSHSLSPSFSFFCISCISFYIPQLVNMFKLWNNCKYNTLWWWRSWRKVDLLLLCLMKVLVCLIFLSSLKYSYFL